MAAWIGGVAPHPDNQTRAQRAQGQATQNRPIGLGPPSCCQILLLSTLLHTDIAIEVTEDIRSRFAFLSDDGFPLYHNQLRYLVIGWGSKAFYPSAKSYSEMGIAPLFKAVTGDQSVLHIMPASQIKAGNNVQEISLSLQGYHRLVEAILGTLKRGRNRNQPIRLQGKSFGAGDLFYLAHGHFDIFRTCNVWTAKMLRIAGVPTGIWTPTSYSLKAGLE